MATDPDDGKDDDNNLIETKRTVRLKFSIKVVIPPFLFGSIEREAFRELKAKKQSPKK